MQLIIDEIEHHHIEVDEKLPSEREFCSKYDLSRSTVRQAFLELEQDGYIYKIHGKGTFVSPKKLNQELLKFYSFTSEMKKLGKVPTSRVLSFDTVVCDWSLAQKLRTRAGTEVYRFQRLRLADDKPVMIETSYIPRDRFAGFTREMLEDHPMYDIFSHVLSVEKELFTGQAHPVHYRCWSGRQGHRHFLMNRGGAAASPFLLGGYFNGRYHTHGAWMGRC